MTADALRLSVVRGDITRLDVDAVVNAANETLLGGGGVDGAIHRAAGPRLLEACRRLPELRPGVRCPTGEARITPGFDLAARFVIHTVGPIWRGGEAGEDEALLGCYRGAMAVAGAHGLTSVAFPAVSCGVYGFPAPRATTLAVRAIRQAPPSSVASVVLVGFDEAMAERWREALAQDPANGWDAASAAMLAHRDRSTIGVEVLREWASGLPPGAAVLDLGCGGGLPVSRTLVEAGAVVSGVDASPRMVAAYRKRFPGAWTACESAEHGTFAGRRFDAVVAVGLMFVLDEDAQRRAIARVATALPPGGRFLFTAPRQTATWTDPTTGQAMWSLGADGYADALSAEGFRLTGTFVDDGGNHYYAAEKV
ncbi:MAG: O-acetyl-ADP-ribose deacetylase [Vicinamibacterales bacterium]